MPAGPTAVTTDSGGSRAASCTIPASSGPAARARRGRPEQPRRETHAKHPPSACPRRSLRPGCSTDRDTARKHTLEWVTPGHPLFAVEMAGDGPPRRCESGVLGELTPAPAPDALPEIARRPEPLAWLQEHVLAPFLDETRGERLAETGRVADHVELSLTELLQRAVDAIGRVTASVERGAQGAEGRLALAEARHGELLARRERRREELQQQRALSLQGIERITSVLVLPHPDRTAAEVRRHQPDPATEATAMRVVMDHERERGRRVEDVSADNLGYDVTSLDPVTATGCTSSPTAAGRRLCRTRSPTRPGSPGTR